MSEQVTLILLAFFGGVLTGVSSVLLVAEQARRERERERWNLRGLESNEVKLDRWRQWLERKA